MASRGWLGLGVNRLLPGGRTVAAVLSGGGSKASFQIGSLEYLYDHDPDFRPTIFTGASAGAILAALLAQSANRAEQRQYLDRIKDIWTSMARSSDMFTPRPWLEVLRREESTLQALATRRIDTDDPYDDPATLDPLEAALTPDEVIETDWTLAQMGQLMGQVFKLPRLGSEFAAIRQGFVRTKSMYRPGPMLAELLEPSVFDPARVASSGNILRVAMVALESGELHYMREDGVITDRDDQPLYAESYDLTTGVLASCSMPGAFRAVPLAGSTYVDGGTRENLPAELTIGLLKAGRTYIVSSQSLGVKPRENMAEADLFSVVLRASDILIDEAGRDEALYAESAGAIVIRPGFEVHDAMTVRKGLIDINRDYGWSRAACVDHGVSEQQEAAVDEMYKQRLRAYHAERRWRDKPNDISLKLRVASAKRDLQLAMRGIDADLLPPGHELWWRRFERHGTPIQAEPFWTQ